MSRAKDPDDLRQLQIIRVFVHHDNSSVYDGNKQEKSVSFPCIKMSEKEALPVIESRNLRANSKNQHFARNPVLRINRAGDA